MKNTLSVGVCGSNQFGQSITTNDVCEIKEFSLSNIENVRCGGWHSVILCLNNFCVFWGSNFSQQIPKVQSSLIRNPTSNLRQIPYLDIVLGSKHTVILTRNNTLQLFGSNEQKQHPLNVMSKIVSVFAKFEATACVSNGNTVMFWGNSMDSVKVDLPKEEIVIVVEPNTEGFSVLCESGKLYIYRQIDCFLVGVHEDVISVASTRYNTYILKKDGKIYMISGSVLVHIVGIDDIPTKVFAGGAHIGCVTITGKCYIWGCGTRGQLANGTFTNSSYPKEILLDEKRAVIDAAAGEEHTVFILCKKELFVPKIPNLLKDNKLVDNLLLDSIRDITFSPNEYDIKF